MSMINQFAALLLLRLAHSIIKGLPGISYLCYHISFQDIIALAQKIQLFFWVLVINSDILG